jgi:putative oxidoreductase
VGLANAKRLMVNIKRFAPIPLRLIIGCGFVYHGLLKFTLSGHADFAAILQKIGIAPPEIIAWLLAAIELLGGLALIAGAMTVVCAAILIVDMLVAMSQVHWSQGFNFIHIVGQTPAGPVYGLPGYEVNLLYIAGLLSLLLSGAGPWSVDEWLRRRFTVVSRDRARMVVTPRSPHPVNR